MKKALKWIGILLLVVVITAGAFAYNAVNSCESRLAKAYEVTPAAITLPTDSAAMERGEQLARVLCTSCHGNSYEGMTVFNDPSIAVIKAPNLTAGNGGIGARYTDADWVRALRHGLDPTGRPLFVMPSGEFKHLSTSDLGALLAYMKTVEPVDNEPGPVEYGTMGKMLVHLGAFGDVINAETIDHAAPLPPEPVRGTSAAHGEYIVNFTGCRTCHGAQLNGGKDPNPEAPMGPNLTKGGTAANWDLADFTRAMRAGITPDGRTMNPEFMPWKGFGQLHDEELEAVHNYLRSLEALPTAKI